MGDLTLTTFDWVPEPPRGYVRDLRVRWARWKRAACPIVSRAYRFAVASPSISCTSPSARCRG